MAIKNLKLVLKVDSKSGQASIKKVSDQLKELGTVSAAGISTMGKGASAASDSMKKMEASAAKANETYRKIIDASKDDAERLKTLNINKKMWADEETRAIADASKRDSERVKKLIRLEKERAKSIKKGQDSIVKIEKERIRKAIRAEKERAAYVNKAHGEAIAEEKRRAAEIAKTNRKIKKQNDLLKKQSGPLKSIKQYLFAMRSYWLAISAAVSVATISVVKFFKAGFMAVEKFRLSVASMAASITTFSDLSAGDVDEVYANATLYAEELALKMELINVRTIATGEQLRAMNETFIQQGVLLDVNSKKQEDAFVAIANAISLITQGQNQEIQMRQEVRGLLSGDIRATNLLARMIDTKVGGALKENINLWKRQGTLIVNLGKHLEGFKAGSEDLASTWAALSTTFDTIINRHLREAFKPIYADIIKKSLEISRNMLGQKEAADGISESLRMKMSKVWVTIKNVVQVVLDLFWWMKQPLQLVWETIKLMADGLGYFFALIAPITKRFRALTKSVQSTVMAILRLGEAAWRIASFDFAGAAEQFKKAKAAWKEGGQILGEAFGEGLALEIALSLADYTDPVFKKKTKGELPKLREPGASEEGLKRAKDWFATWEKMEAENQENRIKIRYEGHVQSLKLLDLEKERMVAIYGEQLSIEEHFNIKRSLIHKKMAEDAKEAHAKVIEYISSERENKVRAIFEEADALKDAAKTKEELDKIAAAATKKIQALEKEAADERAKNHEKILQFTSTELENKVRAVDIEKEKLLELATTYEQIAAINEAASEKKRELLKKDATAMEEWAETAISFIEQVEAVNIAAAESFSSGFSDAFHDFLYGTKTAKEAITDFAITFFRQLSNMIIQQLILNALKEVMGTTTDNASTKAIAGNAAETGSVAILTKAYIALAAAKALAGMGGGGGVGAPTVAAKGMVVSNGQKMMEYARGGVVDSPVMFPMKNGTGLMGEKGPEAIMPLARGKGGRLGVESVGEKDVQIMPQEVNIVNVFNTTMLDEYLSTSAGQDAIVNVIGGRAQSVKRILR